MIERTSLLRVHSWSAAGCRCVKSCKFLPPVKPKNTLFSQRRGRMSLQAPVPEVTGPPGLGESGD